MSEKRALLKKESTAEFRKLSGTRVNCELEKNRIELPESGSRVKWHVDVFDRGASNIDATRLRLSLIPNQNLSSDGEGKD